MKKQRYQVIAAEFATIWRTKTFTATSADDAREQAENDDFGAWKITNSDAQFEIEEIELVKPAKKGKR